MRFDLSGMSEGGRRAIGVFGALAFVLVGYWIATVEIGAAPADDEADLWRRYAIFAGIFLVIMVAYSIRKLTRPSFDTSFPARKYFWLLLGLVIIARRALFDDTAGAVAFAGIATGFFGGMLLVYGFDAVTNRLSKGRSWRYPDGVPGAEESHQSNTSSTT